MQLYRVTGIAYWKNGSSRHINDRKEINVVAGSVKYALVRANAWAMRNLSFTEKTRATWARHGWTSNHFKILRFEPESVTLMSEVEVR